MCEDFLWDVLFVCGSLGEMIIDFYCILSPFCILCCCFFFRHKFNNFFCAPIEWENGEQEKIAVNNNEVKFILALSVLYAAFYNRIMILLIFIELLWQPLNLLVNSWSLFDFYEVKSDAILEFKTKTLEKV